MLTHISRKTSEMCGTQDPFFDEKAIRRAAVTQRIPTMAAARAAAEGIAATQRRQITVNALQEARLSSEIENIVTTSDELYRAAANGDAVADAHTKEVLRYREALWYSFEQIAKRPLSANLAIEIVGIIRQVGALYAARRGTNRQRDLRSGESDSRVDDPDHRSPQSREAGYLQQRSGRDHLQQPLLPHPVYRGGWPGQAPDSIRLPAKISRHENSGSA